MLETTRQAGPQTARRSYHHGDLAAALVAAGLEVTRTGGPDALSLREVTRRAGVSPNAAYRHFADRQALLSAVSAAIQQQMAAQMATPHVADPAELLRAVGLGYIEFALAEPGWFAVAFFGADADAPEAPDVTDSPPYRALVVALDAMLAAGLLTPEQRAGAEWPCWSAVHGFAELALHGPLRSAGREAVARHAGRTVAAIIAGLSAR